ncbi:MAG: hypothetical protein KDE56_09700 [Anaerolineales bacterium]|nr:hypothetical protein [Anaerolineales bacterium]
MPLRNTPPRPRVVTIALWGVFFFGVWHLGQAIAIGRQLRLFLQFDGGLDPRWRLAAAVVWVLFSGWVIVLLWYKRPLIRLLLPLLILSNTLYNLTLLLLFAQQPVAVRLTWLLIGAVLVTLFSLWVLHKYFKGE